MKQSFSRISVTCVLAILGITLAVLGTSSDAKAKDIQKQTVVLFQFAVGSDIDPSKAEYTSQHARDLFLLVNDGLTAMKRFSVVQFEPRIASVDRAVREERFTEKDITSAVDTSGAGVARAQGLGALVGGDVAVVGSLDRYEYDSTKQEVQVTASLAFVDLKTGKKTDLMATGRAAKGESESNQSELALGIAATYDVAQKLLADAGAVIPENLPPIEVQSSSSEGSKSKGNKGLIPAMIGAALLGLLLGGK